MNEEGERSPECKGSTVEGRRAKLSTPMSSSLGDNPGGTGEAPSNLLPLELSLRLPTWNGFGLVGLGATDDQGVEPATAAAAAGGSTALVGDIEAGMADGDVLPEDVEPAA